ncbi:outer membrane lipoprotein-sorting protein [bacterium]|nr:MAG: outer membrane lipoprotein-sorting protein [bacterium]
MRFYSTLYVLCVFLSFLATSLSAQTAYEIVKKSDDLVRGKSSEATITMTIVRPDWSRSISMKSWALGTEYSLTVITQPARDKGTVFLKRKNEIWNWVPNIGRSVKLPPSMMMQSWMGSDFTNDDLVKESSVLEDYSHEMLSEETIDGKPAWKIKLTPKPDSPVVWGKVIMWITQKDFHQLKTEFYDEDDFLVNTLIGSEIKTFDGRSLPSKMEMIPADKPGNKTVFVYEDLKFNINAKPSFFSIQNMKKMGE